MRVASSSDFSPVRELRPLIVSEIVVLRARGNNQRIITDRLSVVQKHVARLRVEIDHFGQQHSSILLPA